MHDLHRCTRGLLFGGWHASNHPRHVKAPWTHPPHPLPAGEYLDYLVQTALNGGEEGQPGQEGQQNGGNFLSQLARTANSLQYFMKSLTK